MVELYCEVTVGYTLRYALPLEFAVDEDADAVGCIYNPYRS